jgi:hypothetical protein
VTLWDWQCTITSDYGKVITKTPELPSVNSSIVDHQSHSAIAISGRGGRQEVRHEQLKWECHGLLFVVCWQVVLDNETNLLTKDKYQLLEKWPENECSERCDGSLNPLPLNSVDEKLHTVPAGRAK